GKAGQRRRNDAAAVRKRVEKRRPARAAEQSAENGDSLPLALLPDSQPPGGRVDPALVRRRHPRAPAADAARGHQWCSQSFANKSRSWGATRSANRRVLSAVKSRFM